MTDEEAKVLVESNLKEAKADKRTLLLHELRRLAIFESSANLLTAFISGAINSDEIVGRLIAHGVVSGGAALVDIIIGLLFSDYEFANNRNKIILLKKYQYELKNNINRFQDVEAKDFKSTLSDDLSLKRNFR